MICSACVFNYLLQTGVASSANLSSEIKVAALLLADGSRPAIKASEIRPRLPPLAAVTTVSGVKGEC